MITIRHAPLVYARTAYLDYRSNFIGVPDNFSLEAREQARGFVLAALDYAEMLDDGPRWVMFRAGHHLIAGVVSSASFLSDTQTHELTQGEDGATIPRRRLHAFVGSAFHLDKEAFTPPRTREFYAALYSEVVGPRFLERIESLNWQAATPTAYREILLAAATGDVCRVDPAVLSVYPDGAADELWLASARGQGEPSLCTNAPAGRHKQHRVFDVVSQLDITEPRVEPRQAAAAVKNPPTPRAAQMTTPEDELAAYDAAQKARQRRSSGGSRPGRSNRREGRHDDDGDSSPSIGIPTSWVAAVVVLIFVGTMVVFLERKKLF